MKFTTAFKEKIKKSKLRMQLGLEFDVSYHTIDRWVLDKKGKEELTKDKYLKGLCEFTGLSKSEIFSHSE